MNEKGFSFVFLFLIALFILVGTAIGAFFLGRNSRENSSQMAASPTNKPIATTILSPAPTQVPTNWITFVAQDGEISFKFPNNFIVCDKNDGENLISIRTKEKCEFQGALENSISITDQTKSIKNGTNQLFNHLASMQVGATREGMTEGEKTAGVKFLRMSDEKIGNREARNYMVTDKNDGGAIYSFVFLINGKIYFISRQNREDFSTVFDEIVSTIEFADGLNI